MLSSPPIPSTSSSSSPQQSRSTSLRSTFMLSSIQSRNRGNQIFIFPIQLRLKQFLQSYHQIKAWSGDNFFFINILYIYLFLIHTIRKLRKPRNFSFFWVFFFFSILEWICFCQSIARFKNIHGLASKFDFFFQ